MGSSREASGRGLEAPLPWQQGMEPVVPLYLESDPPFLQC